MIGHNGYRTIAAYQSTCLSTPCDRPAHRALGRQDHALEAPTRLETKSLPSNRFVFDVEIGDKQRRAGSRSRTISSPFGDISPLGSTSAGCVIDYAPAKFAGPCESYGSNNGSPSFGWRCLRPTRILRSSFAYSDPVVAPDYLGLRLSLCRSRHFVSMSRLTASRRSVPDGPALDGFSSVSGPITILRSINGGCVIDYASTRPMPCFPSTLRDRRGFLH
jgi:hypothetical protein